MKVSSVGLIWTTAVLLSRGFENARSRKLNSLSFFKKPSLGSRVSSESLKKSMNFFKKPVFGSRFRLRPYHFENPRSRLISEAKQGRACRFRLRPYHFENPRSRLISEVKQGRAWLVLGWETAWEYQMFRFRLRPYHFENARSRLISEAKQGRAWLVLGWETAWEYQVL
ncbi:unnamed protein product [Leuciscus chuanchicus]